MDEKVIYGDGINSIIQTSSSTFNIGLNEKEDLNIFLTDIAQSRFFTIVLEKLKFDGEPIKFKFPKPTGTEYVGKPYIYEDFLPVKNIGINFTSYDNLSVPFNVFSNLPILHKKGLPSISINCYDVLGDIVERAVQVWEAECFPNSKYVAYLSEVASKFTYVSYNVSGKVSYTKTLYVIPTGGVSVNRGYDDNSEKVVSFNVVAVGEPGASSTGSSGGVTIGDLTKEIGGYTTSVVEKAVNQIVGAPLRNVITDFTSQ